VGWRAVLPNEKHEFSAGWQAAQKGGTAGCTTGRASRLYITEGCTVSWAAEKGGPEGCLFLQPAGPPFCAAHRPVLLSSVQLAESPRFSFGNMAPSPPALQLVLSIFRVRILNMRIGLVCGNSINKHRLWKK